MNRSTIFASAAVALAALCAPPLHAAKLTLIDRTVTQERWINGERVEDVATLATPESWQVSASASSSISNCDLQSGCTSAATARVEATFEIEPDPGESVGDTVTYCAAWSGGVQAAADPPGATAAASGGGEPVAFAAALVNTNEYTALASTDEPEAFVEVVGAAKYPLGQLAEQAPPDAADADEVRQEITAVIGDEIILDVSAASAVATPPEGNGSASASGRIEITLGPCDAAEPRPKPEPTPIPTMGGKAALLLAAVLGLFGLMGLRRRRSTIR